MISRKALRKLTYALAPLTLLVAALIYVGDRTTPVDTQAEETVATPGFVGADASEPLPVDGMTQDTEPSVVARSAVTQYSDELGIDAESADFSVERVRETEDGRSSVRLRQEVSGVPVIAGELIVNLNEDNQLLSISGETTKATDIKAEADLSSEEATEKALAGVTEWHGLDAEILIATEPELSVYDPTLLEPSLLPPALVWLVEVSTGGKAPVNELVLVNAVTGGIALHFNQIHTARDRKTYDANNTTSLPGTLRCDEGNPTCSGGDTHEVDAHEYAGDVYDFYLTNHGRDSYDNAGRTMRSTVHYGSGYFNAFWDGSLDQAVFGDGQAYPRADDVVAHEWTHAVTGYESGLYYYYQAGAINESLSDVWGEIIDQGNGSGDDSAGVKWLLGEDLSGAIRDMADPTTYGDPDKMTSGNYHTAASDSGGVHTNSGVNNKAAYLMTDGGTFNGQTVDAMGTTKVVTIYYEAQINLLTSGSNYNDLYNALYQGCQNVIGTNGINSGDCDNVRAATLAVEMDQDPTGSFHPSANLCPNDASPEFVVFSDDFETGAPSWFVSNLSGSNTWSLVTGFASSGTKSLYDWDASSVFDSVVYHTDQSIPADAFLLFKHSFTFDAPDDDGGVLEYSTNGGGAWNDASSMFVEGQDYTGTISGTSNTLNGRSAFIGDSHGYTSSRYDLSSLEGESVRFRFRSAGDSTGSALLGWLVDEYSIHTCDLTPPALTLTPSPLTPDGLAGWYSPAPTIVATSNDTPDIEFQLDGTADVSWTTVTTDVVATDGVHTYYYRSTDGSGNIGTANVTLSVDVTPPSAPGLTIKLDGPVTADLTWTPSVDSMSGLGGYKVFKTGQVPPIISLGSGETSATVGGFTCCADELSLQAEDIAGNTSSSGGQTPSFAWGDANAVSYTFVDVTDAGAGEATVSVGFYDDSSGIDIQIYDWPTGDVVATSAQRSIVISGLTADVEHAFISKVRDSNGHRSAAGDILRFTLTNPGTTTDAAGAGVPVTVRPSSDLNLTFSEVTASGATTSTPTSFPGATPFGFSFLGDIIDISTTATFTGPIAVSLQYDEADLGSTPEDSLRLFHFEGGSWADVTTHVDTQNNVIHGSVSSLSPFGMGGPALEGTGGSSLTWLAGIILLLVGGLLYLRVLRQRV